jgi:hypothetical protein
MKDFVAYLEEKILPWFFWIEQVYDLPGFHAWDATAAVYLTDPQLFDSREVVLHSDLHDLNRGFLRIESVYVGTTGDAGVPAAATPQDETPPAVYDNTNRINVPTLIRDLPEYWQTLFNGWYAAGTSSPE